MKHFPDFVQAASGGEGDKIHHRKKEQEQDRKNQAHLSSLQLPPRMPPEPRPGTVRGNRQEKGNKAPPGHEHEFAPIQPGQVQTPAEGQKKERASQADHDPPTADGPSEKKPQQDEKKGPQAKHPALNLHEEFQEHAGKTRQKAGQGMPSLHQPGKKEQGNHQHEVAADHVNIPQCPLEFIIGPDAPPLRVQVQSVHAQILKAGDHHEDRQGKAAALQENPVPHPEKGKAQEQKEIAGLADHPLIAHSAVPHHALSVPVHFLRRRQG